jgi:hypothetical protein
VKAPDWYADWRRESFEQLLAKQQHLKDEYGLGGWPRYDYDLDAGLLTLSDERGPRVSCDVEVAGTVGEGDWLWGWANAHLPKGRREKVLRVKAYGEEHGIEELSSELIEAADLEGLGWMLTAATVRLLDAEGAYKSEGLFMTCHSFRRVS